MFSGKSPRYRNAQIRRRVTRDVPRNTSASVSAWRDAHIFSHNLYYKQRPTQQYCIFVVSRRRHYTYGW